MTEKTGSQNSRLSPRDKGLVIGVWAIWSLAILLLAGAVASLPGEAKSAWPPELAREAPPIARWDAGWYYGVARDGYRYDPGTAANNIHFYPLYPLLVGFLGRLTQIPLFQVGIGISLASLLGALLILANLQAEEGRRERIFPGIAVLLLFPTSFYFASFYTESFFLLTTVAAFRAAQRGRWLVAGLAGAAASLTRLNGILIVVPIAWFAWRAAGGKWRSMRPSHGVAVAGPLLGAAIFPFYLWRRFGNPFLYFSFRSENTGWPHRPQPAWKLFGGIVNELRESLTGSHTGARLGSLAAIATLLLFLALTVGLFRRREVPEALYAAATLFLLINSGSLHAIERYALPLFPCFFLLGDFLRRRPVLACAYAFGSAGLLVTFLVRFVHWKWVA